KALHFICLYYENNSSLVAIEMISIIISAGQAKRLRPLTETRLKGSLPILNEPILVRMADMLEKTSLLEKLVIVVSSGQEEEIKSLFTSRSYYSKVFTTVQDPPRGTADAVAQGEKFIDSAPFCLVMNGDVLSPLDEIIPRLISHHNNLAAKCSMVVFPGESTRYGLLQITNEGKVLSLREKAKINLNNEEQGYINAGIYWFPKEIFDVIRETPISERGEYEITDSITLQGKGGSIGAIITNTWMSIENPIDLFNAQLFFTPFLDLSCMQFHSGSEIGFKAAEDIYFEADTSIEFSSIRISGPVLIGKGTLIETGSEIGPRAFIGRNCEIGSRVKIAETLLMNDTRIGQDCSLFSVIAGEDLVMGSSTFISPINANEKLFTEPRNRDKLEEFVVIGGKTIITNNVSISKGMKIPAHSVISNENLEEKSK
ncbi:MAG: sugar phosphate nucleotidyltransferase, partial [Candidatus Thorarchaeota archaeon]